MAIALGPSVLMPHEMMGEILSHLDAHDLGQCLFVSRQWSKLASSDQLWKVVVQRLAPGASLPAKGLLAFLSAHAVLSKVSVALRLEKFSRNARWFLNNSFVCFFPYNEKCVIKAELGLKAPHRSEYKEICIFMRTLPNPECRRSNFTSINRLLSYFVSLPAQPASPLEENFEVEEIYQRALMIPLSEPQVSKILRTGAEKLKTEVIFSVAVVAAAALGRLQAEDLPD